MKKKNTHSSEEFKTEKSVYTPNDFVFWQANGLMEVTPKFQRRAVWRTPARSFFIDTLLRGMTVPPLYLRMTQNKDRTKPIRQVVDGQQRVLSVVEFIGEKYRLSKTLNASWAGKKYSQLSTDEQQRILSFSFSAEIFKGISDAQVLEVFCRLNMNGIPLNNQELRNGKYFGLFKTTAFDIGVSHLEFWRLHKVFTEINIARMLEVELTSELLIASSAGMQDKKATINLFYEKWEVEYPNRDRDSKRFYDVFSVISDAFSDGTLASSEFRRPPLFYSLFCVVYHRMFGLPEITRLSPKKKFGDADRENLREAVILLSEMISQGKDPNANIEPKYARFVLACQSQTDNISSRKVRFDSIYDHAF